MSPHPPFRGRFSGGDFPSTADRWRAAPSEPFGTPIAASRWTSPQAWQGTAHTNTPNANATNGAAGVKKRAHGEAFSGTSPAITPLSRITRSGAVSNGRPLQAGREHTRVSPPKGTVVEPYRCTQWSAPSGSQFPTYQNPIPSKSAPQQWSTPTHYQTASQPRPTSQNPSHQNSYLPRPALHSKEAPRVYESEKPSSQRRNTGHDAGESAKSGIVLQQGSVIVLSDSDHEDDVVELFPHRVSKGLPQKQKVRGSSAPASRKAKAAGPDRSSRTAQTPQDNGKGSHVFRSVVNAKAAELKLLNEAEQVRRLEAAQTLSAMLLRASAPRPRVPPFLSEDPDSLTEYTAHDMRILYNRYGPDILRAKQASYDEFGRVNPSPGDDDWAFDDEWIQQWIPMKPGQEHVKNVRDKEVLGGLWPDWLDEDGTVRYLTEIFPREIVSAIGNPGG